MRIFYAFRGNARRPDRIGPARFSAIPLLAALIASPCAGQSLDGAATRDPSALCEAAIRVAERQYRLPAGLLPAIGLAESGHTDPATGRQRPWPWAVQAGATSLYFASKAEAVSWVRTAQAQGVASIDTGCLQVNLFFHPDAFRNVDSAFDPMRNVDYAARFLLQLYAETNDWARATGLYHSRTPALRDPYQQRVARIAGLPSPKAPPTVAESLAIAWRATLPPAVAASAGLNNLAPDGGLARDRSRQTTAPPGTGSH